MTCRRLRIDIPATSHSEAISKWINPADISDCAGVTYWLGVAFGAVITEAMRSGKDASLTVHIEPEGKGTADA